MRNLTLAVGILALAMLVGGCAEPEMLYRATPVSDNTVWYSGREYVTKTQDSVTVSVAFENELESTITFYVVVGNLGSAPVLVAPEKIYYEGYYKKMMQVTDFETMDVSYDTSEHTDTIYAVNPETALQGIDRQVAQANATYANQTGLNVAAGLLQLVGDVATIGQKKTKEEIHRENENRKNIAESQEQNNLDYSMATGSIANQRAYWESTALRKTTLFKNNAIGGRVRIPVDPNATMLTLFVPVDSNLFTFQFRQRQIPPQ